MTVAQYKNRKKRKSPAIKWPYKLWSTLEGMTLRFYLQLLNFFYWTAVDFTLFCNLFSVKILDLTNINRRKIFSFHTNIDFLVQVCLLWVFLFWRSRGRDRVGVLSRCKIIIYMLISLTKEIHFVFTCSVKFGNI